MNCAYRSTGTSLSYEFLGTPEQYQNSLWGHLFDQTKKLTFRNYHLVLDCIIAIKKFKAQHETFSMYYVKLCLVCNTLVTINFI